MDMKGRPLKINKRIVICHCCGDGFQPNNNGVAKWCSKKCNDCWEELVGGELRLLSATLTKGSYSAARCLGYDCGVNKETRIGQCDWCEEEFTYTTSFNKTKQTYKEEPPHCSKVCFNDSRCWGRIREGEWSYYAQIEKAYWRQRKADYPMNFTQTLYTTRRTAKIEGLPHDLDEDYLWSIRSRHCAALGYKFIVGGNQETYKGKTSPKNWVDSATLDKFIPEKGYVKGNVYWISNRANRIKTDAKWHEVMQVAIWMLGITLYTNTMDVYNRTARVLLLPIGSLKKWMKKMRVKG